MNRERAIAAGDIFRDRWPDSNSLGIYLGSGRCGATFDPYGLPGDKGIMHRDCWCRGEYGKDSFMPVYRVSWKLALPGHPMEFHQHLSLFSGILETKYSCQSFSYCLKAAFNPQKPDLLYYNLEYSSSEPAQSLALDFYTSREDDGKSNVHISTRLINAMGAAQLVSDKNSHELQLDPSGGQLLWVIGISSKGKCHDLEDQLDRITQSSKAFDEISRGWSTRWGSSYLSLPDPKLQALWARSVFWLLSSYGADSACPAPPCGWSGHAWPYAFPQDLSYIHPALLRLGHLDIVKAWVENFAQNVDPMEKLAEHIWGASGTMWAWEFPISTNYSLLRNGSPNHYQFELHNAAYPARMALETSAYLRDPSWTREVAWPIVRGSARFYASLLKMGQHGYGLSVTPSMGQDEHGGINGENYLCSLYAAEYSLTAGLRLSGELGVGREEASVWRGILNRGLAFGALRATDTDIYHTMSVGDRPFSWGVQKHPVQLNPLFSLPLGTPGTSETTAYRERSRLCNGTLEGRYFGWTLGAYLTSSTHLGDAQGLAQGLEYLFSPGLVDSEGIQIYESTNNFNAPYFTTGHGLLVQALCDAFVHDFFGTPVLGSTLPQTWEGAECCGFHTAGGQVWSVEWDGVNVTVRED